MFYMLGDVIVLKKLVHCVLNINRLISWITKHSAFNLEFFLAMYYKAYMYIRLHHYWLLVIFIKTYAFISNITFHR